jgi:glycosyltransferase involved in cell wall biosynthesis
MEVAVLEHVATTKPLRIGLLVDLAARKLGSLEMWLLGLAAESRRRGHSLQILGREPLHPEVARRLSSLGVPWTRLEQLLSHPVRSVVHLARRFDVLHLNLFAPRHPVALMAYAAWPARVLFVDHFSTPVDGADTRPRPAHALLDRATLVRVSGLAGVSSYVRDRSVRRFRFPRAKARTIYNGVDLDRFRPDAELSSRAPDVRIITVAYLIRDKGVEFLIRAFARLGAHNARLLIVGDGPEEPRLRQLSASLGIASRTEFLGLRDDVPDLLRAAHVFVHPCLWQEACGLAVLEAMASGCAVVASRTGALPEIITDGQTGLLVPPGDEAALGSALDQVVSDPRLRARLGEAAREAAVQRFGLQQCVAAHLDWCEEAVQALR